MLKAVREKRKIVVKEIKSTVTATLNLKNRKIIFIVLRENNC